MATALDQRIGETLLGKYEVKSILGRGGMGVVYEAEDTRLGRHVAIKVLNQAARSQKDADQRFHLEARAIASLIHPHLVTLLDYDFLDDGTPCMVMERVEGMSLKAAMARRTFTPLEVTLVLYQTLLALSACHSKGVIHRDLKPENLLLTRGGPQGITVKVIDFGLTKLLADSGAGSLTVNGQVFGSPRFMAPEQWLQKEVTPRTDLYALGLIGYCLVRGEHFITAQNPFEICRAHISQPRPPLRATSDGTRVPTLLDHVLRKAADPDPRNRYESAEAMIAALESLTMDAMNFARFTGEHAAVPTGVSEEQPVARPFDAAAMAASIDASIAAGELDSLELTQPGLEAAGAAVQAAVERGSVPATALDTDDDHTVSEELAPVAPDPLATLLLQPALDLSGAAPGVPTDPEPSGETPNRVKFAVSGGVFTAITRGDVERAMNDAAQTAADETTAEDAAPVRTSAPPRPVSGQIPRVSQPPTASTPPKVPPSPAVRSAAPTARSRDGATNERRRATVQVQAMPESGRTLRSTVLVIAGVVVAATIGAAVAWFWMP
jgi:serine/threonine-protein kinase